MKHLSIARPSTLAFLAASVALGTSPAYANTLIYNVNGITIDEEGEAKRYERARYGAFRVAEDGDAVLVGLVGEDLAAL